MQDQIKQIQNEFLQKISDAKNLEDLDKLFLDLFGKTGKITLLPRDFSKLAKDELKEVGPLFNRVKKELEESINERRDQVREASYKNLVNENLDLTRSVKLKRRQGHLHPITEFENKIADVFSKLGFQQFDAPHIETDYYNFESLNIPQNHLARDIWDTLYIADPQKYGYQPGELLLRTHTSNAQVRIMEQFKPPFRFMIIDHCFRYENLDARHEHTFDQFEIVYVDKGLSMANLQYLSEYFLKKMLGEDIKARLSPGYFPFTEPSAHLFGSCVFCKGKGCKICGGAGELELAGAGMIHPQVLKNGGIDPNIYSGIAWGVGPGRMAMLKYNVNDVRLFNSGDLKFLQNLKEDKLESS